MDSADQGQLMQPMVRVWTRRSREIWENDLYKVKVIRQGSYTRLAIKPKDGGTRHKWAEFQQIKNEILGREWEAVELYPAESRLVNKGNKYHLWCTDKGFELGFQNANPKAPTG